MLLDSLTVQAFRGIKNEVELDLRARLTLVYSPNGVGKTSLCDAVEWLFTGEVQRLKEGLDGTRAKGIQNIFVKENPPAVDSVLRTTQSEFRVRRVGFIEPTTIESFTNNSWHKVALNTVLAKFTPENLISSANDSEEFNSRRIWFRAVRFLETYALHLLLDNDDQSNEIRDLVFCELLGVGELQRREHDLRKIISFLGEKSRLANELKDAQRRVMSAEAKVRQDTTKASVSIWEDFKKLINAATKSLELTLSSRSSYERQLAITESACAKVEAELGRRNSALDYVIGHANTYSDLRARNPNLVKKRSALQERKSQINLAEAERVYRKAKAQWLKADNARQTLLSLPLNAISARLEYGLRRWQKTEGQNTSPRLDDIQSFLTETEGTVTINSERIVALAYCQDSIRLWRDAKMREERGLEKLRKIAAPPQIEVRTDVEKSLAELKEQLSRANDQYHRLIQPLEQIKILGRHFSEGALVDQHRCPLCGHDHGTAYELRHAIESGLDMLPIPIIEQVQRKEGLLLQIADLEQRIREWSEIDRTIGALNEEVERARHTLAEAEQVFRVAGLSLKDLQDDKLENRIQEMRSEAEREIAKGQELITQLKVRFEIAAELQSVVHEFESIIDSFRKLTKTQLATDFQREPGDEWLRVLKRLERQVRAAILKVTSQTETAATTVQKTKATLKELRDEDENIRISLVNLARQADEANREQHEFEKHWQIVAGDIPWDTRKLDPQVVRLTKETQEIRKVRQKVDSARIKLAAAREVESRERERANSETRLAELQGRVRELEEVIRIREECIEGANSLRKSKDAFIRQQIQPFCDVITALYIRAQSAFFIDRIDSSLDDGPLRWLAHIGDYQLEDTAHMSLGQRQDLALAIFLSRARELGGTFFLDEPLLHLDDLNRVALLDVLRTIIVENLPKEVRLVVTTANESLVRHCQEKFALVEGAENRPSLRVYRLIGGPQSGIAAIES